MNRDFDWMWSEACDSLARAERLHRQFFQPRRPGTWEPPVDILETEREVLLFFALPGVSIDKVEAIIDGADLVVVGTRVLPPQLRTATIHRIELPQGRFEVLSNNLVVSARRLRSGRGSCSIEPPGQVLGYGLAL